MRDLKEGLHAEIVKLEGILNYTLQMFKSAIENSVCSIVTKDR